MRSEYMELRKTLTGILEVMREYRQSVQFL